MTTDQVNPVAWRIKMFFGRWLDYLIHIPLRILRFLRCFLGFHTFYGKNKLLRWLSATIVLIVDITPASVLYECMLDWFKLKTRPLTPVERHFAKSIYENRLPYHLIGIDTLSLLVKQKVTTAFTTLHTINYYGTLSTPTFIHELMHVRQYRKFGAMYITECIWAQQWGGGYNYGGINALQVNSETGLKAFNFEQQAEIIEDYFRLLNGLPLQWGSPSAELKAVLEKYVNEVRR